MRRMVFLVFFLAARAAGQQSSPAPDPNTRDSLGRTPLHVATATFGWDQIDRMRLLLANGADPNSRDDSGSSPLDEAAREGSADRTALLLGHGARIDAPNAKTGATPLNEAAFKGRLAVMELLLKRGANPALKDNAGFSPLRNAVRQHHPEAARLLLEGRPDAPEANLLLEEAVRRGHTDTVTVLLDSGFAVNTRFASGSTALYDASLRGDAAMVSLLLARGADVNARETVSGTTPLYAAASFGRQEVAVMLLLAAANPNLTGNQGISPLQAAKSNDHRNIAEQIAAAGGR